jgi:hypothetical protein
MVTGGCKTFLTLWRKVEMVKWNQGEGETQKKIVMTNLKLLAITKWVLYGLHLRMSQSMG